MPKIAELKELPFVGDVIGTVFDAAGVTDDDLPDIIRDDIPYNDMAMIEAHMPKVAAKLRTLDEAT
jgi:hypothetical protein